MNFNRPRMNYEWFKKTIKKTILSEKLKNSKKWSEIAACQQKITRANFSHSTSELERKNIMPRTTCFLLFSCFGKTNITTPSGLKKP